MEFYEAVNKRRTVREFLDKEVEFEAIKRILDAGNQAPTWNHNRNWSFIVLRADEEKEYAFSYAKQIADKFDAEKYLNMPRPYPVKAQCNLIWLENLNLRGDYKRVILDYIQQKHPDLMSLYDEIYRNGNHCYWEKLNEQLDVFAQEQGLHNMRNDDNYLQPFDAPPTVVNFFYHEEIKKSAKKEV